MKKKKISPNLKQLLQQLDRVNHEIVSNKESWLRNSRSYVTYAKIKIELEEQKKVIDKKIEIERGMII